MKLTPVMRKFILHWGEMGTRWGINRTVAQVHALLYIAGQPLHAEEIAESLSVARSNASTSLKELLGWGIVKIVHVMGDRRDHFETQKDVWEMFQAIVRERKRREIDPTIELLRECMTEAEKGGAGEAEARQRLRRMLEFFDAANAAYQQMQSLSPAMLARVARAGDKVRKLLGLAS